MAWPTKTNFVDGDVLTAAQVNNIGVNLNLANPTGVTDGWVLTADGAGSMAFEALNAESMTSLASGNLSTGTGTLTLSGISAAYKDLVLYVRNFWPGTSGASPQVRFNNNTGTVYWANGLYSNGTIDGGSKTGQINVSAVGLSNTLENHCVIYLFDYAQATPTNGFIHFVGRTNTAANTQSWFSIGMIDNSAISRIDFLLNTGNFGAGDYVLYGVK